MVPEPNDSPGAFRQGHASSRDCRAQWTTSCMDNVACQICGLRGIAEQRRCIREALNGLVAFPEAVQAEGNAAFENNFNIRIMLLVALAAPPDTVPHFALGSRPLVSSTTSRTGGLTTHCALTLWCTSVLRCCGLRSVM